MNSLKYLLVLVLSISIPIASGLKCYQCGYLKNLDITIPGLGFTITKDCKEGKLSSDYSIECPGVAPVCSKFAVKATNNNAEIEVYLKGCMPKSMIVTSTNTCEDISIKDALALLAGTGIPTDGFEGAEGSVKSCNCDTDECNAASGISATFTTFLGFGVILAKSLHVF